MCHWLAKREGIVKIREVGAGVRARAAAQVQAPTVSSSVMSGASGTFAGPVGGAVERCGDIVEIVIEEIRIDVERHCRGGVAQHALNRLHVRSGLHRK